MDNKISVVIPIYNRAGLIAETLASIEKQSLKPYEVIVVDDHSTDDSVQVIEDFKKNSNLDIIVLTNAFRKGMCGALNWGIKHAKGDLIAMQDSDDLWTPQHLQQLKGALAKYPESHIAFSAIEVFGEARDVEEKTQDFKTSVQRCLEHAFEKDSEGIWSSNQNLLFALLMFGFPFRCQASLIRKKFLNDNDLFFDTDITYTLDSQFMTLASYFSSFLYVEKLGLRLRRHTENDGDTAYGDKVCLSYEVRIKKLKEFFLKNKISVREHLALNHRLWSLHAHVSNQKALGRNWIEKAKVACELMWNVPTWRSAKSAVKLMINMEIV